MQAISVDHFYLVYNSLSFTIATFGAATLFFWLSRSQVAPAYRTAVTITGLVTFIALYHYWRMFESWSDAFNVVNDTIEMTGIAYNRAYRYVDWLLTVPLLLIELILVMRLSRAETTSKSISLGLAAALMIVLGYPGEIATDLSTRALWGSLSMVPFLYIVFQLFVGLGNSIKEQPAAAQGLIRTARLVTVASWGFYPIVFFAPFMGLTGGAVETTIQVGYTIADLVAKAGIGILIFLIAVRKSESDTDGGKAYAA